MNTPVHFTHKVNNAAQALLLLGGMGGLLAAMGWFLAGVSGSTGLIGVGLIYMLFSPRLSPRLVLRLYGARPLALAEAPGLTRAVDELSRLAELPRPPVLYYVPSALLNAFSLGSRKRAALAVTDGLLRGLSSRELVGVLAHEISHIRHNDIWIMGLADGVSRLVRLLSIFGQLLVVFNLPAIVMDYEGLPWAPILLLVAAPLISALLQQGLSRNREFDADRAAARLTGDPAGLASALEKLEWQRQGLLGRIFRSRDRQPSLLRTHPATGERIARLRELAGAPALATPQLSDPFGAQPGAQFLGKALPWGTEPMLAAELPRVIVRPRRRWHGMWR